MSYCMTYVCVVRSILGLSGPPPLDGVEAEGEGVGGGQKRHEGALLQLVAEDGGVGATGGPDRESGGGVADGDGEAGLGGHHAPRGYAYPPRQQLVRHGQEARPTTLLDAGDELALRGDVAVLVEQVLPGHADVVEAELGVVNPVEAHLVTHVLHRDSGNGL